MSTETFYQPLSSIVKIESLPEQLSFVQGGINNILSGMYYKDLQFSQSARGDSAFYSLTLVTLQPVEVEIAGSGIFLVLNASGSTTGFPITLNYRWEILGYLRAFNLSGFSFTPADFYALTLQVLGISEEELINKVLGVFIQAPTPINQFVDDVNLYYDLNTSGNPIPYPTSSNPIKEVNDAINSNPDLNSLGQTTSLVIFGAYLYDAVNEGNIRERLDELFKSFFGGTSVQEYLKRLITPQIEATLQLGLSFRFPRKYLVPINTSTGEPLPTGESLLTFQPGPLSFSTEKGIGFDSNLTATLTPSQIGNSGFTIDITQAKLDLSRNTNIPEADLDGRPKDFIGVYVQQATIGLPKFFGSSSNPSTTSIVGKNLLIGTGGLSGTVGLANTSGIVNARLSNFELSLTGFFLRFHQNEITDSQITGKLTLKGFKDASNTTQDAVINIDVHIGNNGEFSATASAVQSITALSIPNVFDLKIKSLEVGKKDDRFYVATSGSIDFKQQSSPIGKFLPEDVQIKKLIIWDDGSFEIEGGEVVFPKAYELNIGPVKISITAIHLGSHEQEHGGILRKYRYFGFDGGINVNPGGVDARGKGVKFYFTVDNDPPNNKNLHVFLRIQQINIDIIIPGSATEATASVLIKGMLAMKDPTPTSSGSTAGTEYAGSVYVKVPSLNGMEATAKMRLNPSIPNFLVDIGVSLSTPILLGSTGLGIYGFRALLGKRYVAAKSAANLADDAEWWQYYKAKVADEYAEGIQMGKFAPKDGFSFGAGVSLATSVDNGKALSTKLFLLLSLPDVFLFQGQAAILKERIGLDTTPDPPFFMLVAVTSSSVEAAFGVDYKIPDDKRPGSIATVAGVTEMGFFFGNSSAWYINVGRDQPTNRRIQARILELFDMYFYLMLNNNSIRIGAGASYNLDKKFGPLRAELRAYIDIAGRISFKPKQVGGSIQLGGSVGLYIFSFGFQISVAASLAAEAPKPFIVTGSLKVCVRVLKKDRCAEFSFTWTFDNQLDTSEVGIVRGLTSDMAKAFNLVSKETYNLHSDSSLLSPSTWGNVDNYVIPVDSYIDIVFSKPVNANGIPGIGGVTQSPVFVEFVPPQRGKSDRVRHEYVVTSVEIKSWDDNNDLVNGSWVTYQMYNALTPQQAAPFVDQTALANMPYGYWQAEEPGKYTKLRLLAQTPFSYIGSGGSNVIPEDLGITDSTLFCEDEPIEKTCIDFDGFKTRPGLSVTVPSDVFRYFNGIIFRIVGNDGAIVYQPWSGHTNALALGEQDKVEIYFPEPMACATIHMQSLGMNVTITFLRRELLPTPDSSGMPQYQYTPVLAPLTYTPAQLNVPIQYEDVNNPIDMVLVELGACPQGQPGSKLICDADVTAQAKQLEVFFNTLAINRHLTIPSLIIYPDNDKIYNGVFENSVLYPTISKATQIVMQQVNFKDGDILEFNIRDNFGYNCTFSLDIDPPNGAIRYQDLRNFRNIRLNPAMTVVGANYDFLIDADYPTAGGNQTITLKGRSCYPIAQCYDRCSGFIYEFCYLSVEDYIFNQNIPSQSSITSGTQSMIATVQGTLHPIWRPDTIYSVVINTNEKAFREGSSSVEASYSNTYVFGFRTAGPVGHFHKYMKADGTQDIRNDYNALLANDQEDQFKLSGLKHYIDYPKCYPNADGDLINAKPLFYKNPKFLMFYVWQHVYQMFNDWTAYNGNDDLYSRLNMLIKDPAEQPLPALQTPSSFVSTPAISNWQTNNIGITPVDVSLVSNMLQNGNPCDVPPQSVTPLSVNSVFTTPNDLLPLKLYTAIFNADFKRLSQTDIISREVHRYVFQTSRYGNFTEQIESWKLKVNTTSGVVEKAAVFNVEKAFDNAQEIIPAQAIISGTLASTDPLVQTFMHIYDRLIDGALRIEALQDAPTTEFNFVKDLTTGNTLGILVRNPEPFNDPKMPLPIAELTITLQHDSGTGYGPSSDYKGIFSKDYSRVFITKSDNSLMVPSSGSFKLTFEYREYDGNQYAVVSTVVAEFAR